MTFEKPIQHAILLHTRGDFSREMDSINVVLERLQERYLNENISLVDNHDVEQINHYLSLAQPLLKNRESWIENRLYSPNALNWSYGLHLSEQSVKKGDADLVKRQQAYRSFCRVFGSKFEHALAMQYLLGITSENKNTFLSTDHPSKTISFVDEAGKYALSCYPNISNSLDLQIIKDDVSVGVITSDLNSVFNLSLINSF